MRVGFFVTCLVDLVRPAIGFAAIKLLKGGGADVYVPPTQTCCGQPAYNSGDRTYLEPNLANFQAWNETFASNSRTMQLALRVTF